MALELYDSHCHLNFKDFESDVADVIRRAQDAGISKMITICTGMEEVDDVYRIAQAHDGIYATVGIHPHDAKPHMDLHTLDEIGAFLLERGKRVKTVGIGETGLDYYYDNSPRDLQKKLFEKHLECAVALDLPVIVHTREAEEDTIALLKKFPKVRGVIHCFTSSQWLAEQALDLGFYISISGIVTFKTAEALREVVRHVPMERLLVETDAPFLAPIPMRGKRNEPAFVMHTAQFLSTFLEVSLEDLARQTRRNTLDLFNKIKR